MIMGVVSINFNQIFWRKKYSGGWRRSCCRPQLAHGPEVKNGCIEVQILTFLFISLHFQESQKIFCDICFKITLQIRSPNAKHVCAGELDHQ